MHPLRKGTTPSALARMSAARRGAGERWPVAKSLAFIAGSSIALWMLVAAVAALV